MILVVRYDRKSSEILIDSGKNLEAWTEMLINIMKKNDEKAKETGSNSTFLSLKKKNKKI